MILINIIHICVSCEFGIFDVLVDLLKFIDIIDKSHNQISTINVSEDRLQINLGVSEDIVVHHIQDLINVILIVWLNYTRNIVLSGWQTMESLRSVADNAFFWKPPFWSEVLLVIRRERVQSVASSDEVFGRSKVVIELIWMDFFIFAQIPDQHVSGRTDLDEVILVFAWDISSVVVHVVNTDSILKHFVWEHNVDVDLSRLVNVTTGFFTLDQLFPEVEDSCWC